jgi:SAM-dependent methyltransferase
MELAEYEKMYRLEGTYWWWVGRRKIITGILDKLCAGSIKILDVGCGTGINLSYFSRYGSTVGLDISQDALRFCSQRGLSNVLQGDAERLPFEDNSFDLITALDLLEHLDDKQALAEFHRVLKPNGFLILTVPAFSFMWSQHDEAVHHKRRYSKRELKSVIKANGFSIYRINYWNIFLFLPIVLMRLTKRILKNTEIKTDTIELPNIVNKFLIYVLSIESYVIRYLNPPVGVSLVCVAKVEK